MAAGLTTLREFVFADERARRFVKTEQPATLPARLYKYRSLSPQTFEFAAALVARREVYFARPAELNDPYDCRPFNTLEASPAQRRAFVKWMVDGREKDRRRAERRRLVASLSSGLERRIAEIGFEAVAQEAFDANMRDTGILSLSEEPASNLMWSHYADAHRGICVEFDTKVIQHLGLMKVGYSPLRPRVNIIEDPTTLTEMTFLRKSPDWAYEKEWRAVGLYWSGTYVLPISAITRVILGAGISDVNRAAVQNWANAGGSKICVSQAKFDHRSYQLAFEGMAQAAS